MISPSTCRKRELSPPGSPVFSKRSNLNVTDDRSTVESELFTSVKTLLKEESNLYLGLGCPLLDKALGGGIRRGAVTEVVGESSAGKTQFCLSLTVKVALLGEGVIYVCSEGRFPQSRLDQIVREENKKVMDKILIFKVRDLHHLLAVLRGQELEDELVRSKIGLVVVDSVASVVRYEGDLVTGLDKAGAVHRLGQQLVKLSADNNLAVVAINQVTDKLDQLGYSPNDRKVVGSLGLAWLSYPHTRLWLAKTRYMLGNTASNLGLKAQTRLRTMEVDFSCRLPPTTTHFIVEQDGIRGVIVTD